MSIEKSGELDDAFADIEKDKNEEKKENNKTSKITFKKSESQIKKTPININPKKKKKKVDYTLYKRPEKIKLENVKLYAITVIMR